MFSVLHAKFRRGPGSKNKSHHAPECWSQTWSTVLKVTQPHSMMKSQRPLKIPPARALARRSLLKSKTCRRKYVRDTNEWFGQKPLAIIRWHTLTAVPAFCSEKINKKKK